MRVLHNVLRVRLVSIAPLEIQQNHEIQNAEYFLRPHPLVVSAAAIKRTISLRIRTHGVCDVRVCGYM